MIRSIACAIGGVVFVGVITVLAGAAHHTSTNMRVGHWTLIGSSVQSNAWAACYFVTDHKVDYVPDYLRDAVKLSRCWEPS